MIPAMCEQFVARAAEPFRLDALWDFAERLERYGLAGFGWGATWLLPEGGLETYRDVRAFRDDPGRDRVGAIETTSVLVHLRRPSRLSTLQLADTQPFVDPAGRFAFAHNGDLRDFKAARAEYRRQARIHGRADSEVGQRWLEDAWSDAEPVGHLLGALHEAVRWRGEPRGDRARWHAAPLRGQPGEPGVHVPPGPHRARVHGALLRGPLAVPLCGARGHGPVARAAPPHHRARRARRDRSMPGGTGHRPEASGARTQPRTRTRPSVADLGDGARRAPVCP